MIKVKNIVKSYGNGASRFQVLQDISLEIDDGDFVALLGASGSGKSTFLNVISGLERPDSGSMFYDTTDITALSDDELTAFRKETVGSDLEKNGINIQVSFPVANSKGFQLPGHYRKIPRYCSLMSLPVH